MIELAGDAFEYEPGVCNIGSTFAVTDAEARAADRAKALQIGVTSAVIGAVVGVGAVLTSR